MTSDQDTQLTMPVSATTLSRKAWTAYISIGLRALIFTSACIALVVWRHDLWQVTLPIFIIGAALIGYRIAYLRSFQLYYDDNGVWIYSGLLPWKRGVSGVKWRDLDEAVFVNGFWSWVSGSYTVQLKHRFAKTTEIYADDMAHGKEAVIAINQHHRQYIGRFESPSQQGIDPIPQLLP